MATDVRRLRRVLTTLGTAFGVAMLIVSLTLLAETTQNSLQFSRFQLVILALNAAGVGVMSLLILFALGRLARDYRRQLAGARLKVRMVSLFAMLALAPVLLVFAFSLQFITRGIDSWFDEDVEIGLRDALDLSRQALDARKREVLEVTRSMGAELAEHSNLELYALLERLRTQYGASEVTVYGAGNRILALSARLPDSADDAMPHGDSLPPLRQNEPYVAVEPLPSGAMQVRTAIAIGSPLPGESRVLETVFPVPERFANLAETIQGAYNAYGRSEYLRRPLKYSFALTLTLVLLLSALSAVWGAIFAARRVVAPIQDLVAGTRAVAQGDFSRKLPVPARDDIGFLVNSFNEMTERLGEAREIAQASQQEADRERAKLATILASLSTGVIALEPDHSIRIANAAAKQILGAGLPAGGQLAAPGAEATDAPSVFAATCRRHFEAGRHDWREQIALPGERGPRVLICSCTSLPGESGSPRGSVLVFDEVTSLLQAQRDAAWGEVARRLAHEIKNPLTPIKLSAERLRRRYLETMPAADAAVLDRATHTIIQQVDAMRGMVDAFRDYARAPDLALAPVEVNRLVSEVVELYRVRELGVRLTVTPDDAVGVVEADGDRLRQILHNLLTNAVEAIGDRRDGAVEVSTRRCREHGYDYVELRVEDNGHGFRVPSVASVFEPYVTTKAKGTGLGLAIVRKIVEEHNGAIDLGDRAEGGAWVSVRLPCDARARADAAARQVARAGDGRAQPPPAAATTGNQQPPAAGAAADRAERSPGREREEVGS